MKIADRVPLKLYYNNCTTHTEVIEHYSDRSVNNWIGVANSEWRYAMGLLGKGRMLVSESKQSDADLVNTQIGQFGTVHAVQVGDMISVLFFETMHDQEMVFIAGFIAPSKVARIKLAASGKIETIFFENGMRFPEYTPIIIADVNRTQYAVFFDSSDDAEQAIMVLSLAMPENWELINEIAWE